MYNKIPLKWGILLYICYNFVALYHYIVSEMQIKTITHHHIHRSYHALTFITSVILVAFFSWFLGIALTSVNAQSVTHNTVAINSLSPDVEVLPSSGISKEKDTPESRVADPKITAIPGESIQQRYVLQDGEVQPIFVFKNQFPKFIGQTNIQDSTAALDIFGNQHVTGKAVVDSNGNWKWESTIPLKPGTYTFTVKAVTGQSSKALASDSFLFEIVLDPNEEPLSMKFNNTPQLGNGGVLFDVRAVIPVESKQINAGDPIKVDVKFINFGSPNKAVDVEVQYTITNEENKVVSVNSETMAVNDELEFYKSFNTSAALPSGEYTLTVAVPSQDLIATATDKFRIGPIEESASAGATRKSPFQNKAIIIEIIGAMLFLGTIVGYMEYNKMTIFSKNIKQLNEKDLFKKKSHA